MSRTNRLLVLLVSLCVAALTAGLTGGPAQADPAAAQPRPATPAPGAAVPATQRDAALGRGWAGSRDFAVTGAGDVNGFHLFRANAMDGYRWQPLVTLSEAGFDTDQWIGNVCVTGDGGAAVVVYAPRTFTNKTDLFARGGFVAVVDLVSGTATKLPVQASLAYFNPGCGAGSEAILTQGGGDDKAQTRLVRLDTKTKKLGTRTTVAGQLTSALPVGKSIVGADNGAIVSVDGSGRRHAVAGATGTPFRLAADRDGGVTYLERHGNQASVRRVVPTTGRLGAAHTLANGPLSGLDITRGTAGRVFVLGGAKQKFTTTSPAVSLRTGSVGSTASGDGSLLVTRTSMRRVADDNHGTLDVAARAAASGKSLKFRVAAVPSSSLSDSGNDQTPALRSSAGPRPKSKARLRPSAAGPGTGPADLADRYCSVPRNDPANQAMQPKPKQVEWAVDQAVRNSLKIARPANWKNLAMPAYTPQGLFPYLALDGGGYIPAQVMLGIAMQESNLWEAHRSAVAGVTGNPLIGNYYGRDIYNDNAGDDWDINWANADCGYGVTQVTDGMRLAGKEKPGEKALAYQTQRAVALDFAANVAAGTRILASKWNQTRAAGMKVNNGDPARIENWFYAIWAYNSGFHPQSEASANSGAWGLGWANNPGNPNYPANREFFMLDSADAAKPQLWPYPEKVIGFAAFPPSALESPDVEVPAFRQAYWNGTDTTAPANRLQAKPPVNQFCNSSNNCEPGKKYTPDGPEVIGEPAGPCAHVGGGYHDLKCWYHQASTWKSDCATTCGYELLRYDPGYAYQDDGAAYPPSCSLAGLPSGAQIVDDVPDSAPIVRPGCSRGFTNAGDFGLVYNPDSTGHYSGRIDTHQLGAGFAGHFWFTHTYDPKKWSSAWNILGSWTLKASHTGPMKVMVALPDLGADTPTARYTVHTARGDRVRTISQSGSKNRWVSLGAFQFDGQPSVTLSNMFPGADDDVDIAFDAVAFVPIAGTFHEDTLEADALFDENQNIDTNAPSWLAGPLQTGKDLYDFAMDSTSKILAAPSSCNSSDTNCTLPATRAAMTAWRKEASTSGYDPVNHPLGHSISRWIGFSNSNADRPTSNARPASFDDDDRFKIRSKVYLSYVAASDGKVVAGSEWLEYSNRTGNTHLPQFVHDFITATVTDYGAPRPDLTYTMDDANIHNGNKTKADPLTTGILPGRAYAYAGMAPTVSDTAGNPSSTGSCIATDYSSGGSIGYRPMLDSDGPPNAMSAWVIALGNNIKVPVSVYHLAQTIRDTFFRNGNLVVNQSSFAVAPPIWQEITANFCSDGTIRKVKGNDLLRASFMPDQYFYRNGVAMDLTGKTTTSAKPVMTGDFQSFAHAEPGHFPAYGRCNTTGRGGNPWTINVTDGPGANPSPSRLCSDMSSSSAYSSG